MTSAYTPLSASPHSMTIFVISKSPAFEDVHLP